MANRILIGSLLTVLVLLAWGIWTATSSEPIEGHTPVPCRTGTCWEANQ